MHVAAAAMVATGAAAVALDHTDPVEAKIVTATINEATIAVLETCIHATNQARDEEQRAIEIASRWASDSSRMYLEDLQSVAPCDDRGRLSRRMPARLRTSLRDAQNGREFVLAFCSAAIVEAVGSITSAHGERLLERVAAAIIPVAEVMRQWRSNDAARTTVHDRFSWPLDRDAFKRSDLMHDEVTSAIDREASRRRAVVDAGLFLIREGRFDVS